MSANNFIDSLGHGNGNTYSNKPQGSPTISTATSSNATWDYNNLKLALGRCGSLRGILHKERVKSFMDQNWPWIDPVLFRCTPDEMSMAGLIYCVEEQSPKCIACDLCLKNMTENCDPWDLHKEKSPDCPFIQLGKRKLPRDYTFEELMKLYLWKAPRNTGDGLAFKDRARNTWISAHVKIDQEDMPDK